MTCILIANDQAVVRRGIREVVQSAIAGAELHEAGTVAELQLRLAERTWDLMILEVTLGDSSPEEMVTLLQQTPPKTRVLIVTALPESGHAMLMLRAGAHGYIDTRRPTEELVHATRAVLGNGNYLTDDAMRELLGAPAAGAATFRTTLSSRELAVLCCLAQGKAVKQIARELGVSEKTVATYIGRIRQKTGLHNYVDMTRFALRNRLVN
jgi:two-component system, NarL family, invasion response regulator UvrY